MGNYKILIDKPALSARKLVDLHLSNFLTPKFELFQFINIILTFYQSTPCFPNRKFLINFAV